MIWNDELIQRFGYKTYIDDCQRVLREDRNFTGIVCYRCKMKHTGSCDIPKAPIYVVTSDKFFKDCPCVPCADMNEANKIYNYILNNRTDQKYPRICIKLYQYRNNYKLMLEWREYINE